MKLSTKIKNDIADGVGECDQPFNQAKVTLADHQRKKVYLQTRIAEVVEEKKVVQQLAAKRKIEKERDSAVDWYITELCFRSEGKRDYERGRTGTVAASPGPYYQAKVQQEAREHEWLMLSREPLDPFAPPLTS
jgi:hypothetical protein